MAGTAHCLLQRKIALQEVNAVTRAAKDERTSAEQACEADFYVGMSRLSAPSEARPLLEAAAKFPQQIAGEIGPPSSQRHSSSSWIRGSSRRLQSPLCNAIGSREAISIRKNPRLFRASR